LDQVDEVLAPAWPGHPLDELARYTIGERVRIGRSRPRRDRRWCAAGRCEALEKPYGVSFELAWVGGGGPPGRLDRGALVGCDDQLHALLGERLEQLPPGRGAAERRAQIQRRGDDQQLLHESFFTRKPGASSNDDHALLQA